MTRPTQAELQARAEADAEPLVEALQQRPALIPAKAVIEEAIKLLVGIPGLEAAEVIVLVNGQAMAASFDARDQPKLN